MHTEKVFGLLAFEEVQPYFALADIVVVALALGALFAAASALGASYVARLREFSTLMALGFTRRRVAAMFTAEALIATFLGGGLGIALAFALTQGAHALLSSAPHACRPRHGGGDQRAHRRLRQHAGRHPAL